MTIVVAFLIIGGLNMITDLISRADVYWTEVKQSRQNQCLEQGHLYQECYRLIYRGEKF